MPRDLAYSPTMSLPNSASSIKPRPAVWPLLILCALAVVLRVPSFVEPLGRDCGEFLYIGRRMLDGARPYVDFWEHKPPGIFYAYALCVRVFGYSRTSPLVFSTVVHVATLLVVYAIGRRMAGPRAGFLAAAFFTASTAQPRFWGLGNGQSVETLMLLPLSLGWLCAMRAAGRRGAAWACLSGFLMAGAFWLKATAALPCAVVFFTLAASAGWPAALAFVAGSACALVPVPLAYAAAGLWREFFGQAFVDNFAYAGVDLPLTDYAARAGRALWYAAKFLAALFAFGLAGAAMALARRSAWRIALAGWAVAGAIPFFLGARFFPHYLIEALAPLALLAGLATDRLVYSPARPLSRAAAGAALCGVLGWNAATYAASHYRLNVAHMMGQIDRNAYRRQIPTGRPEAVGEYLRPRLSGDRRLLVWGQATAIYPAADATSSSRYLYSYPFLDPISPGRAGRVAELLGELRARPPEFIVVVDPRLLPELRAFIQSGYAVQTRQFGWVIWRRRGL